MPAVAFSAVCTDECRNAILAFRDRTAYSFHQLAAALHVTVQHAPRRIRKPDLHILALFPHVSAHTTQRASSTSRTNECIDLPVGLAPDFRSRSRVVRVSVGLIVELVRPNSVGERLCISLRLMIIVLWIVVRDGWNSSDIGAQHAKKVDFFLALICMTGQPSALTKV